MFLSSGGFVNEVALGDIFPPDGPGFSGGFCLLWPQSVVPHWDEPSQHCRYSMPPRAVHMSLSVTTWRKRRQELRAFSSHGVGVSSMKSSIIQLSDSLLYTCIRSVVCIDALHSYKKQIVV